MDMKNEPIPETFKAKCRHRIETQYIHKYNENKVVRKKIPIRFWSTILAKSFSVYMNRVMETNWSEWSVALLYHF